MDGGHVASEGCARVERECKGIVLGANFASSMLAHGVMPAPGDRALGNWGRHRMKEELASGIGSVGIPRAVDNNSTSPTDPASPPSRLTNI